MHECRKKHNDRSGIYGFTQGALAYNSNKIEGSTLTEDQTAALFEEGFLPVSEDVYRAKDIEEMNGHFLMFHHMLATIDAPLSELICWYHDTPIKNLETIARLHSAYERIHPFQDGNGRTGRIIMFRECIKNGLCPFIVEDKNRIVYVTSLKKAQTENLFSDLVHYFKEEQSIYQKQCAFFSVEERYQECKGL